MVPSYAPLTTTNEREKLRKRRLLSGSVLINLTAVGLFCLQGFFTGAPLMQQAGGALGCCLALFVLWINKHDHLKIAGLLHTSFTLFVMILMINILSLKMPLFSFFVWAMLPTIPVMAGLFLPAWGPLLLTIFGIAFMNWFILSERHSQIATYMTNPGLRIQFIFFSSLVIFVTGILSAIYASTTKKAVIQADRAIELGQAHHALTEAYTRLEQAHTTIQMQALTDGLTGLPNHRAIMNQLTKELDRAGRYDRPFALLFFDADRFKHINDTYGHAAGDAVLRQIGELASSTIRGGDTLGRFGGEEFVVLLPEAGTTEANTVAERIRTTIAAKTVATSEIEGGIAITVSIGIATYLTDGNSGQELLSQADEAMYVAKRMGRNQIRTAEEARQMGTDVDLMALLQEEGQREIAQRAGMTPEQLRETYMLRSIYSLLSLLERRDPSLNTHAHAVSDLATNIAQELGLGAKDISRIGIAALLHDIGKVAVPDVLLQKTGPLTSHERTLMQEHAELGAQILEASPILSEAAPWVRHHHECWDGHGYPDQLAGEDIPLAARIIAVAEAYDAMQEECSYQARHSPEEALAELRRCAGTQFDPNIVQILSTILARQASLSISPRLIAL
jgi:diguanylate cyclase (GGDEF)-like protein/putative nucleotidyltransferase with HDIG domain